MTTAQFSEFSYGYAITDNVLHSGLPYSGSAPVFPSLIAEGSSGGGYDVEIPLFPVPLFLQFKVPQVMKRGSEKMPNGFTPPYCRAHLRTKQPNQHQLLLNLEGTGKLVSYVFPAFWRTEELDYHFSRQQVHSRSLYVRPTSIGSLDDEAHHLAYRPGNEEVWLCSRPTKLPGTFTSQKFGDLVNAKIRQAPERDPLEFLTALASDIQQISGVEISLLQTDADRETPQTGQEGLKASAPPAPGDAERANKRRKLSKIAREIAYAAQIHLGCTLAITGRNREQTS